MIVQRIEILVSVSSLLLTMAACQSLLGIDNTTTVSSDAGAENLSRDASVSGDAGGNNGQPVNVIFFPPPFGGATDRDTLMVRGQCTDPDGIDEVRIGNVVAQGDLASWQVAVSLTNGTNDLTVECTDRTGETAMQSISVERSASLQDLVRGQGPVTPYSRDIAYDAERNQLLVLTEEPGGIVGIEPLSGNRTELRMPDLPTDGIQRGILFQLPASVFFSHRASTGASIMRYDLINRQTEPIATSNDSLGGHAPMNPSELVVGPQSALYYLDINHGIVDVARRELTATIVGVQIVYSSIRNRFYVVSAELERIAPGSPPEIVVDSFMGTGPQGDIVLSDDQESVFFSRLSGIYRIDLVTFEQTPVSEVPALSLLSDGSGQRLWATIGYSTGGDLAGDPNVGLVSVDVVTGQFVYLSRGM